MGGPAGYFNARLNAYTTPSPHPKATLKKILTFRTKHVIVYAQIREKRKVWTREPAAGLYISRYTATSNGKSPQERYGSWNKFPFCRNCASCTESATRRSGGRWTNWRGPDFIVKRRGRGQGTFAVKRLTQTTLRVLLLADFDIYKSAIETCHEVFDLLAGIQEAAAEVGAQVQQVSSRGFDSLPPAGADIGYLVIAMT